MLGIGQDADPLHMPEEVQDALLDRLAELVEARGVERMITAPILQADESWFPDRWEGGSASLRRLLARLVRYAQIPNVQLEVEVHRVDASTGTADRDNPTGREGGVWLDRVEGRTLHFAAIGTALENPLVVVPAAARAVAHGWLSLHDMIKGDQNARDRSIDIASVYLGFGLLVTDAALRTHSKTQGMMRATRSQSRLGVLGPQGFAFVFAATCLARRMGPKALKQLAAHLQPNPRAFFRHAVSDLELLDPPLPEALGCPTKDEWPEGPDMVELLGPLPEDIAGDDDKAAEAEREEVEANADRGVVGMNVGKPVFRVDARWGPKIGKALGMGTIFLGGMAGRVEGGPSLDMSTITIAAVVLGLSGWGLGSLFRDVRCSESKCQAQLTEEMTECPRCGGTIRGTIKSAKERLAAEEALLGEVEASDAADAPAPKSA